MKATCKNPEACKWHRSILCLTCKKHGCTNITQEG